MNSRFGPAFFVTAAFIGPGTITVCSLAGYLYGYTLLWALLFSILTTLVLQTMCARLGVVTGKGLGENLRQWIQYRWLKNTFIVLIFGAIVLGNCAYQAGNITGAAMGASIFSLANPDASVHQSLYAAIIGLLAAVLLVVGTTRLLQIILMALVGIMALVFLATAIWSGPALIDLAKGLFLIQAPGQSFSTILALVGTTVVPYNLFLHTSAVSEKWHRPLGLKAARLDTLVAVVIGGVISMAIVVTAGAAQSTGSVNDISDLALQLRPLLGSWATAFLATGMLAAGLSSALTAPLAAGYAYAGMAGLQGKRKRRTIRFISLAVLGIGWLFSLMSYSPVQLIYMAQIANAILLPVIAAFLLLLMNNKRLLGKYVNTWWQNTGTLLILVILLVLSIRSLWLVFEQVG